MNKSAIIAGLTSGYVTKIPFSLRKDRDALLAYLSHAKILGSDAIKPHIANKFYGDKEVVIALANVDVTWLYKRNAFEYYWRNFNEYTGLVDRKLYDDEDVVLAIMRGGKTFEKRHRSQPMSNYVFNPHYYLPCASHRLKITCDFLLEAAAIDSYNIFLMDKSFKSSSEFMAEVINVNGEATKFVEGDALSLRDNENAMRTATKSYPQAVWHFSDRLIQNDQFMTDMILTNPECTKFLLTRIGDKKRIVNLIVSALKEDSTLYNKISDDMAYLSSDSYAVIQFGKVLERANETSAKKTDHESGDDKELSK